MIVGELASQIGEAELLKGGNVNRSRGAGTEEGPGTVISENEKERSVTPRKGTTYARCKNSRERIVPS